MQVNSLKLTNFRNFETLESEFGPGVNVLYGNNGAGKTNLLEAVFTLCLGRSQRAAKDALLVKIGSDYYRLKGNMTGARGSFKAAVAYQYNGRKKITLDSVPAKASELYECLSLVAAGPEDSDILAGPPSSRRLFLDLYLSQMHPGYLADLGDYQKALSQRNSALKQEMDPSPFDPLLVSLGARIMVRRGEFLEQLGEHAMRVYSELADGERLGLSYQPRVTVEQVGDSRAVEEAFELALERNRERDRIMQTTLTGPHRDEIDFQIGELPARTHGSQGQWRSAAVSLKLAVYELLREEREDAPILLLDEIFAELDQGREERLIGKIHNSGQTFLTTAVEPPKSLPVDAWRFRIEAGKVVEVRT